MEKFDKIEVLRPGKICTFDPDNLYKQNDKGVLLVEIVEVLPKKGMFGRNKYMVKGVGDDAAKLPDPIEVSEFVLGPAEGMIIIRYPSDTPSINNLDINAVEVATKYLSTSGFIDNSDPNKSIIRRLASLAVKLKYYAASDEV